MRIGVLGTGTVGQTIASRLVELQHEVRMGARSAGNEKAAAWVAAQGARASSGTFAEAAAFGATIVNCTQGAASLDALTAAGAENLAGKVLVDVANPLETRRDRGRTLLFCDAESLGERIQASFPAARVVKTLNTMWCGLMVNPRLLAGTHTVYVCGNDAAAKAGVTDLLRSFGWRDDEVEDLGDITASRATEMVLPLWLRVWQKTGTAAFNFRIVR